MQNNTSVMVLGAPRSGTSAITRLLPILGIGLGDDMVPPNPNNPRGFFEDTAVQWINTRLLETAGRHIEWPGFDRKKAESARDFSRLRQEAGALLRQRLANMDLWAFKDPRATRLVWFWQSLFSQNSCRDVYIYALRDPAKVATSLCASSGLRPLAGLALWLECTVSAIQDTLERPGVVISYENLLTNPRRQLQRIAHAFHWESRVLEKEMQFYENKFIDPSLEHATRVSEDLIQAPILLPLAFDVYNLLLGRAIDDAISTDFTAAWNRLYSRYRTEFPAFLAVHPWMQDEKAIFAPRTQRLYQRLQYHGAGELTRLGRRFADKLIRGG